MFISLYIKKTQNVSIAFFFTSKNTPNLINLSLFLKYTFRLFQSGIFILYKKIKKKKNIYIYIYMFISLYIKKTQNFSYCIFFTSKNTPNLIKLSLFLKYKKLG